MTEPTCINLRERFGDKYRVSYDPAVETDSGLKRDPWYFLMKCKAGELSPQGGTKLRLEIPATMVSRRKKILERLDGRIEAIEFKDVWALLFDVGDFEAVADLIRPKRRQRLTAEQRQERANRIRKVREQWQMARSVKTSAV